MLNARTATSLGIALLLLFGVILFVRVGDKEPVSMDIDRQETVQSTDNSASEQNLPLDQDGDPSLVSEEELKPDPASSSQLIGEIDDNIDVLITRTSLEGATLTVSGLITGLSDGVCTVSVFTDDDGPSASADTISANGNVGCTVNLDISELPSDEDWTIEMSAGSSEQISPVQTQILTAGER